MNKCIRLPIVQTFTVMALIMLVLVGWLPQRVHAQGVDEAPLTIVNVDTTQFPTVKVTVAGATWPTERADAPLQLLVDGSEQKILSAETVQQGIGFMVAIDPNNLAATGENRYTQLTGALLDHIENNILVRNQDWLAAYHLLPTGLQSIQEWTQEPNLILCEKATGKRGKWPRAVDLHITHFTDYREGLSMSCARNEITEPKTSHCCSKRSDARRRHTLATGKLSRMIETSR